MTIEEIKAKIAEIQAKLAAYVATRPQPAKQPPPNNLLNTFCLAIQRHEGWFTGSRSFRNNNPGNLKFANQAKAIGKDDKGFAKFATYQDGFQALKNMIVNAATGKSRVYYPDMNLYQFFSVYAPAADHNNPNQYAEAVAKALNVNAASFTLKQLV